MISYFGRSSMEDPNTCRHPILKSAGRVNGGECLYCGAWITPKPDNPPQHAATSTDSDREIS